MSAGNASYHQPLALVTPTDRGGAILIVNIIAVIISILAIVVRAYISQQKTRNGFRPYLDDLLCYASTVGVRLIMLYPY
jgi:hypothetical protein